MKRRELISLLGGAVAWPPAARAQQAGKVYHIGFLANDPTIRDAVPKFSRATVLINPEEASTPAELKALELAARSLNIPLRAIEVRQVGDLEGAFARMTNERCDALLIPNAELTFTHRRLITQLAAKSLANHVGF